ncbi:MAG: type ISP restriction/modification enzyme [Armatimonadota bacterium]
MPRPEVMRHMLAGENVGLCIGRAGQVVGAEQWNLAFCTRRITDFNLFYRGGNITCPLYLYPECPDLFGMVKSQERRLNMNSTLLDALAKVYGEALTPEQVFAYIYAVLYAPTYREKYADFLRLDFPRVPFPADVNTFHALATLGNRLVDLHLLRSAELDPPIARFEGSGDNRVTGNPREGFRYEAETQRVYINPSQYFAPVRPEVWEYRIGGYQVCVKWLKERAGRQLSLDEIRTYCRIVTALAHTLVLQEEIDGWYGQVEEDIVPLLAGH